MKRDKEKLTSQPITALDNIDKISRDIFDPGPITALENIDKICRNIFDPGKKEIEELIRVCGPERALAILQLAAAYYKSIKRVH